MSQLHAALEAQLGELGFETIDQAEEAGYEVDYENQALVPNKIDLRDLNHAYEDWKKERDELVENLEYYKGGLEAGAIFNLIDHAIKFIKRSSM